MENLLHDLRYGFRMLLKRPGFTAVAVVTLALGIGANTAIFSVVNAVLLRPLPFTDPDRLVLFYGTNRQIGFSGPWAVCDPDYPDWKTQSESFGEIAAHQRRPFNLTGVGDPERLQGSVCDAGLFSLLGVRPALGRAFTEEEEKPGHDDVVVIGHKLWQRRFGSDPSALGSMIHLDGKGRTVIGVMPTGFEFPGQTEVWTPLVLTSDCSNSFESSYLLRVLSAVGGNKSRAAQVMGVDRKTLYRMIDRQVNTMAGEKEGFLVDRAGIGAT